MLNPGKSNTEAGQFIARMSTFHPRLSNTLAGDLESPRLSFRINQIYPGVPVIHAPAL
jgi:hypothetical protein